MCLSLFPAQISLKMYLLNADQLQLFSSMVTFILNSSYTTGKAFISSIIIVNYALDMFSKFYCFNSLCFVEDQFILLSDIKAPYLVHISNKCNQDF